jgi:threonine synthase
VSVVGTSPPVSFRDALFSGLAPDGGLYVPDRLPAVDQMSSGHAPDFPGVAFDVTLPFIDDIPPAALRSIASSALTFPVPLTKLTSNIFLLELFHGPTLAFKDVGARFMANALGYFLEKEKDHLSLVVATSGDTGSAVAHGFFGIPRIDVYILYPSGKISALQEQQMTTLGGNIHAIEVEGTFDDCQRMVKQTFRTPAVTTRKKITTANSINVGRLLPQIAYYYWAVVQLRAQNHGADAPVVVVPSGNFGNLTAAMYARGMGAVIARCVAATNVNDVVPRFLSTGHLATRQSVPTYSNARDVGDPSNLARLRHLLGDERLRRNLSGARVTDEETLDEMHRTFEQTGIIIDPHTAVGVRIARSVPASLPVIVPATAHPAKFPDVVQRAIGRSIPVPPALAEAMSRKKQTIRVKARMEAWTEIILAPLS